MSVRGWVQACEWQPRGSELTADAVDDAIVLTLEDLTDFDDAGGILSINDQTISYDAGAIDEDAGTILVNTGLADAAAVGDPVCPVSGGQVMRDVVLFVSCGDGDDIEVRVQWSQRDYWPEGDYDEPVQVVLSDDLETVLDAPGRIPQSTGLAEARGGYEGSLQDLYDAANAAAAAAADAAANATTALTAANGKNVNWYSLSAPGSTPNAAGDNWFRKDSSTQTIIEHYIGQGGTTWQQVQLNNQVIANLDAGKLIAGTAFTNALSVKTNFTLGDASTNGVIQSYDFAGSSVGVYIDKFGLVAKGGSIAAAAITGSTITGSSLSTSGSFPITIAGAGIGWSTGASITESGTDLTIARGSTAIVLSSSGIDMFGTVDASGSFGGTHSGTWSGSIAPASVTSSGAMIDTSLAGSFADASINTNGRAVRTTSTERVKKDITPIDFDEATVLAMQEVKHHYIDEEIYGDGWFVGLVAEQLIACGMGEFVFYDQDGLPEGIHYPKLIVPLLNVARKHREELDGQSALILALTARIEALEG